jgi:ferredoxin
LCEPECPAEAICQDTEIPPDQVEFIELNADLSKKWPNIIEVIEPPADADEWNGVANKRPLLEE